jgi:hypothetical protein
VIMVMSFVPIKAESVSPQEPFSAYFVDQFGVPVYVPYAVFAKLRLSCTLLIYCRSR